MSNRPSADYGPTKVGVNVGVVDWESMSVDLPPGCAIFGPGEEGIETDDHESFVSHSRATEPNVATSLHEARTPRSQPALLESDQGCSCRRGRHPDRSRPADRRDQTDQRRTSAGRRPQADGGRRTDNVTRPERSVAPFRTDPHQRQAALSDRSKSAARCDGEWQKGRSTRAELRRS